MLLADKESQPAIKINEIITEIGSNFFILSFLVLEKYLQDFFETVAKVIAQANRSAFDNIAVFNSNRGKA
jgi:hypothetical protein